MITSTAQTNSGMAVADSPPIEITRSRRLPSFQRREHPAEIAERHDDDEREQGELGRVPEGRPEQSADGLTERRSRRDRPGAAADPVAVLDEDRPVGPSSLR